MLRTLGAKCFAKGDSRKRRVYTRHTRASGHAVR
jgi:type IV secretory pathway TrbD component